MKVEYRDQPESISKARTGAHTIASWAEKILKDIDLSISRHLEKEKNDVGSKTH